MKLIYQCQKCHATITIYQGDPVGLPFAKLPAAIAEAMQHRHTETKKP
jgi:hypothetical protein